MKNLKITLAALLCFGLTAWAQDKTGAQRSTDEKAADAQDTRTTTASSADVHFVIEAGTGGLAEVEMGKLALRKGQSQQVKEFGKRLVADHERVGRDLARVAKKYGIDAPNWLEDEHRKHLEMLEAKKGSAFDDAFAQHMVEGHQKMIAKFKAEAEQGQAQGLREFATSTLPALQEHLRIATELTQPRTASR